VKELLWQSRSEPAGTAPLPENGFAEPQEAEPSQSPDLRAFIQKLEDAGRLLRVKETVDSKLGIGRWSRSRHKPLLFEKIMGYGGQEIFTNGLADPTCIRLALGFDALTPWKELIEDTRKRLEETVHPRMVRTGPLLDNVIPASVIDLLQFPVPQWSDFDTGRYLGTWHLNISKDPDTGQRTAGVYRMQLLGAKRATISAAKASDLARHVEHAEARGIELPVAVAIGAPEAMVIAASAACPAEMDEFDLAGALQAKPVELLRCGGLEVPANAEIVIEGFIHPGVRVEDGPYLDYSGRSNTNPKAFLFEATRLMHRSHPIFRGCASGKAGAEDHQMFSFLAQLGLLDFHGSKMNQRFQNLFWRRRAFRTAQWIGRMGSDPQKRK
jgi:4-hydroxy-3-polyprenylbenzoate decarboxylase